MSKDKGGKNVKKEKGGTANSKVKVASDYKLESKTGYGKEPALNVFAPKTGGKGGGSSKSK